MSGRHLVRPAVLAFVLVAPLGVCGLLVAGAADQRGTAFSLEVDDGGPVTTLRPGDRACQGPLPAQTAFGGLEVWVGGVRAPGTTLRIAVVSAAGDQLAAGELPLRARTRTAATARLNRVVPAGSSVSLCFQNVGRRPVPLVGAPAEPGSGVLERDGRQLSSAASIVLLRQHSRSLLSLLPTVFDRAALWRPAWMGAWTYWLLVAGLAAAFPLAAIGLRAASQEDAEP